MSRTIRVVHGLTATYASFVVKAGTKLLVTPFYLAVLGPELMGFKSFIGETMAYFDLFDFGVGTGLTAIVAKDLQSGVSEDKKALVERQLRGGAQIQLLLAAVVILMTVLLAVFLDRFAQGLPRQYWTMARICTLLFGLNFAVYLSSRVYKSILVGKQLIAQNTLFSVAAGFFGTVVGVTLVWFGWSLYGVVIGVLCTALWFFVQSRIRVARMGIRLRPFRPPFEKRSLVKLAPLSGWILLASVGGLLSFNSARIILGVMPSQGMEAVNRYSLLLAVPVMIRLQANRIAVTVRPGLTQLVHSGGGEARGVEVARLLVKITGLLGAGAFVGILLVNGAFVTRWVGAEYYAGDTANLLLAALIGLSIWTFAFKVIAEIRFDFRRRGIGFFATGLITAAGSILLAPRYGISGVLAAAIVGECVASTIWFVPWGIRWVRWASRNPWADGGGLILVPALVVLAGFSLERWGSFVPPPSWPGVLWTTAAVTVGLATAGVIWLRKDLACYLAWQRIRHRQ